MIYSDLTWFFGVFREAKVGKNLVGGRFLVKYYA